MAGPRDASCDARPAPHCSEFSVPFPETRSATTAPVVSSSAQSLAPFQPTTPATCCSALSFEAAARRSRRPASRRSTSSYAAHGAQPTMYVAASVRLSVLATAANAIAGRAMAGTRYAIMEQELNGCVQCIPTVVQISVFRWLGVPRRAGSNILLVLMNNQLP